MAVSVNMTQNTLKNLVNNTILQYSLTTDTLNLIRASCSYFMMSYLTESKLFNEFFNNNK